MWVNFLAPSAAVIGLALCFRKEIKKSLIELIRKNRQRGWIRKNPVKQREAAEKSVSYSKNERGIDTREGKRVHPHSNNGMSKSMIATLSRV
ncbi:hypothetical protein COB64_01510 [Candidatus Wolfebacteria bacterium]|nr:MAG: hypothetical protein COB64_01510 [Candidatus Wolfebacteria bacterium]